MYPYIHQIIDSNAVRLHWALLKTSMALIFLMSGLTNSLSLSQHYHNSLLKMSMTPFFLMVVVDSILVCQPNLFSHMSGLATSLSQHYHNHNSLLRTWVPYSSWIKLMVVFDSVLICQPNLFSHMFGLASSLWENLKSRISEEIRRNMFVSNNLF